MTILHSQLPALLERLDNKTALIGIVGLGYVSSLDVGSKHE